VGSEAAPWLDRLGKGWIAPGLGQNYYSPPSPIHFGEGGKFTFTRGYIDVHGNKHPPSIVDSHGKLSVASIYI
jgi:hypothetical protein